MFLELQIKLRRYCRKYVNVKLIVEIIVNNKRIPIYDFSEWDHNLKGIIAANSSVNLKNKNMKHI